MRISLKSTSTRTFAAFPLIALIEQTLAHRPLRLRYLPVLGWGFLQYRLSGQYRVRVGGGGPGMDNPPDRLVTSGIYAQTRNPMYLGHLVFLSGLYLVTRSWLALALLVAHVPWFNARAKRDEDKLEQRFGESYRAYRHSVRRWVPFPL